MISVGAILLVLYCVLYAGAQDISVGRIVDIPLDGNTRDKLGNVQTTNASSINYVFDTAIGSKVAQVQSQNVRIRISPLPISETSSFTLAVFARGAGAAPVVFISNTNVTAGRNDGTLSPNNIWYSLYFDGSAFCFSLRFKTGDAKLNVCTGSYKSQGYNFLQVLGSWDSEAQIARIQLANGYELASASKATTLRSTLAVGTPDDAHWLGMYGYSSLTSSTAISNFKFYNRVLSPTEGVALTTYRNCPRYLDYVANWLPSEGGNVVLFTTADYNDCNLFEASLNGSLLTLVNTTLITGKYRTDCSYAVSAGSPAPPLWQLSIKCKGKSMAQQIVSYYDMTLIEPFAGTWHSEVFGDESTVLNGRLIDIVNAIGDRALPRVRILELGEFYELRFQRDSSNNVILVETPTPYIYIYNIFNSKQIHVEISYDDGRVWNMLDAVGNITLVDSPNNEACATYEIFECSYKNSANCSYYSELYSAKGFCASKMQTKSSSTFRTGLLVDDDPRAGAVFSLSIDSVRPTPISSATLINVTINYTLSAVFRCDELFQNAYFKYNLKCPFGSRSGSISRDTTRAVSASFYENYNALIEVSGSINYVCSPFEYLQGKPYECLLEISDYGTNKRSVFNTLSTPEIVYISRATDAVLLSRDIVQKGNEKALYLLEGVAYGGDNPYPDLYVRASESNSIYLDGAPLVNKTFSGTSGSGTSTLSTQLFKFTFNHFRLNLPRGIYSLQTRTDSGSKVLDEVDVYIVAVPPMIKSNMAARQNTTLTTKPPRNPSESDVSGFCNYGVYPPATPPIEYSPGIQLLKKLELSDLGGRFDICFNSKGEMLIDVEASIELNVLGVTVGAATSHKANFTNTGDALSPRLELNSYDATLELYVKIPLKGFEQKVGPVTLTLGFFFTFAFTSGEFHIVKRSLTTARGADIGNGLIRYGGFALQAQLSLEAGFDCKIISLTAVAYVRMGITFVFDDRPLQAASLYYEFGSTGTFTFLGFTVLSSTLISAKCTFDLATRKPTCALAKPSLTILGIRIRAVYSIPPEQADMFRAFDQQECSFCKKEKRMTLPEVSYDDEYTSLPFEYVYPNNGSWAQVPFPDVRKRISSDGSITTLMRDVYVQAGADTIKAASSPDGVLSVWPYRNSSLVDPLSYSYFYSYQDRNNSIMTTPKPINTSIFAAFNLQVISLRTALNDIVFIAVWEHPLIYTTSSSGDLSSIYASTEMYSAEYAPSTDSWSAPVRITQNSVFDGTAGLCRYNNSQKVSLVYIQDGSPPFTSSGTRQIFKMDYTFAGKWQAPVLLGTETQPFSTLSCEPSGDNLAIVYTIQKDANSTQTVVASTGKFRIVLDNIIKIANSSVSDTAIYGGNNVFYIAYSLNTTIYLAAVSLTGAVLRTQQVYFDGVAGYLTLTHIELAYDRIMLTFVSPFYTDDGDTVVGCYCAEIAIASNNQFVVGQPKLVFQLNELEKTNALQPLFFKDFSSNIQMLTVLTRTLINATTDQNLTTYTDGRSDHLIVALTLLPNFYVVSGLVNLNNNGIATYTSSITVANNGSVVILGNVYRLRVYSTDFSNIMNQLVYDELLPTALFNQSFTATFSFSTNVAYGYLLGVIIQTLSNTNTTLFRIPLYAPVIITSSLVYTPSGESFYVLGSVSNNVSYSCPIPVTMPINITTIDRSTNTKRVLLTSNFSLECSDPEPLLYKLSTADITGDCFLFVGEYVDKNVWKLPNNTYSNVTLDVAPVNLIVNSIILKNPVARKSYLVVNVYNYGFYNTYNNSLLVYFLLGLDKFETPTYGKYITGIDSFTLNANQTRNLTIPLPNIDKGSYRFIAVVNQGNMSSTQETIRMDNYAWTDNVTIFADARVTATPNQVTAKQTTKRDGSFVITLPANNYGDDVLPAASVSVYVGEGGVDDFYLGNIVIANVGGSRCKEFSLSIPNDVIAPYLNSNSTLTLVVPGEPTPTTVYLPLDTAVATANDPDNNVPDCSLPLNLKPKFTAVADLVIAAGTYGTISTTLYDVYCKQSNRTTFNVTGSDYVSYVDSTSGCNRTVTVTFFGSLQDFESGETKRTYNIVIAAVDSGIPYLRLRFTLTVLRCPTDPCSPSDLVLPSNRSVSCGSNLTPDVLGYASAIGGCFAGVGVTVAYEDIMYVDDDCPARVVIERRWRAVSVCGQVSVATQYINVFSSADTLVIFPDKTQASCALLQLVDFRRDFGDSTALDLCVTQFPTLPLVIPTVTTTFSVNVGVCVLGLTSVRTITATDVCGIQKSVTNLLGVNVLDL